MGTKLTRIALLMLAVIGLIAIFRLRFHGHHDVLDDE